MASAVAVTGTDYRASLVTEAEHPNNNNKGLARKLTCCVVTVILFGVCLIFLIQVVLTLTSVSDWGEDTKQAMIKLEKENMLKLASDKAEYVTEIFGRLEESLLQLQAFAGQALLLEWPGAGTASMILGDDQEYLKSYSGLLEPSDDNWDHSVWFLTEYGVGETPAVNSSQESLLNRSSLMDVPFRGMQRQHLLIYLAALDDPLPLAGEVSDINMQSYAGYNMSAAGYLDFGLRELCSDRFDDFGGDYVPDSYDPRCRPWYQNAAESSSGEVIFTSPYTDVGSEKLVISVAAPVFADDVGSTVLLGVVGIDVETSEIEKSIIGLSVVGEDGYAYLLAPGGTGEVAVHRDLQQFEGPQDIFDLEVDVEEEELDAILSNVSDACTGVETYEKDGETWILSWGHESVGGLSTSSNGTCGGGFVVMVTVSEPALLEVFSNTESEIRNIVALAIVMMALALVVICCTSTCFARSVSTNITKPVNQLVDVVHALNHMDFSRQAAGTWMVNEVSSPEVERLIEAFKAMTTVVKFANMTLGSGDIDVAQQNYVDALVLFTKLGNDRRVGIVNNNLGCTYTLQARKLADKAALEPNLVHAGNIMEAADDKFADAVTSFQLAIDDAEMLCSEESQRRDTVSPPPTLKDIERDGKEVPAGKPKSPSPVDAENGVAAKGTTADEDVSSAAALSLQLANRKFNLALCLAAKGLSAVASGGQEDLAAIERARRVIRECTTLAADRKDATGDQRYFEYLLALAALERDQGAHRQREAGKALDRAEKVIINYRGDVSGSGVNPKVGPRGSSKDLLPRSAPAPVAILRQRLLAARGELCHAAGDPEAAIEHWTKSILGCGDEMDVAAVKTSLSGLKHTAENGEGGLFPDELLVALGLPTGNVKDDHDVASAVDAAIHRLNGEGALGGQALAGGGGEPSTTNVDLCFVMDCTQSMQSWIDQARNKLFDIISQAKKDVSNLNLRLAFVGFRDFGDAVQYEGPFDFHTEDELPDLLAKLKGIKASGGGDVPEDIAGGLMHACDLSWRSPIRLCMLIADAPCHGSIYHGCRDSYPRGCPRGRDPAKLLYTLQYELGVDFYFVRITSITDKMITILHNTVLGFVENRKGRSRPALRGTTNTEPKLVVHDLGCNNNRFLEAVVESVKVSAGINLRVETY